MLDKAEILEFFRASPTKTIAEKDLIKRLHIDSDHRHEFKKQVYELIAGGELVEVGKKRFALPERTNVMVGYVQANRKGFAFVVCKHKERPELYISPEHLLNAMHGDLVVAQQLGKSSGKLEEGKILKILQQGQSRILGTFHLQDDRAFVLPEDSRIPYTILIDEASTLNARPGQIVLAQILRFDERHRHPQGEIVEVLGFPHTPGMDEKMVIHSHNLPTTFPQSVFEAARKISDQIPQTEVQQRVDLRDECIFTIDGENARDFDDAVSIERLENGNYKLGVHIADVNFYVAEGSELDQEAYQRGTSVYFPDRAIPMFPEHLSSDVCCLREGKDRLANSVLMEFDPTGKQVAYDLKSSVIRSQKRFTYTIVRQILKDQDQALIQEHQEFLPSLALMKDLSELLLQRRMQRGSLDFDLPEPEIVLDIQGQVENIIKAERNLAHRMIEEFMIAANETVASHISWMQMPMIYRTHESPNKERISGLNDFLSSLGLRLQRGKELHPKDFQKLLIQVRHKPIEHLVNILALRAMKQARYTIKNNGHFGLASACYTHFTSPIRRYSDLIVHRILKQIREGAGFSPEAVEKRQRVLETIAEHSSLRERAAMEAEREIVLIKKLRFMQDKVGDVFEGVISGVTSFGLFVELREFFVEGLVHVTQLHDDHYYYQEETYSLVGERFRKRYRIGDSVQVQVAHVDMGRRQIDFHIL